MRRSAAVPIPLLESCCRAAVTACRLSLALIAVGIVVFWRVVLRVLLAIIAIAVVVTVGTGALVLLQGMRR